MAVWFLFNREKSLWYDAQVVILIFLWFELFATASVPEPYFYLCMLYIAVYLVYCIAKSIAFNAFSNNPVIQLLGNTSFAVYLLHRPVLLWFDRLFPGTYHSFMVYWFPNFLLTLSFATVSHYMLEENVKKVSKLLTQKIREKLS